MKVPLIILGAFFGGVIALMTEEKKPEVTPSPKVEVVPPLAVIEPEKVAA